MSIQRWKPTDAALIVAGADVEYVTYADHVAAVAAAVKEAVDDGFVLGKEAAREAIAALPKAISMNDGEYVAIWKDDALAAIDGVKP